MEKILKEIVDNRINSIQKKGLTFGIDIPLKREFPVKLPAIEKGFIICEIKRASPSEGKMSNINDPVEWAGNYINAGADVISVLTEENYFSGSLNDLILIKKKFNNISLLRKDFLIYEDEIEISYRAGADIVLLIASVLLDLDKNKSTGLLKKMKEKAESFGMTALIEIHNLNELNEVLKIKPKLIGINSRDLNTFKINKSYVFGLKNIIKDDIAVIFESGIKNYTDAFFIGISGFKSILIGTSIVKSGNAGEKINELKKGFFEGLKNKNNFFNNIFNKIFIEKKIAVKICGITNITDAKIAVNYGADIIGFIFADSPRQITIEQAKAISKELDNTVLKVGVVVDKNIESAVNLIKEGFIDAIQFHGEHDNDFCQSFNVPWYKAVRVKSKDDFNLNYSCPFILYDAFLKEEYGGTGRRIDSDLLNFALSNNINLFLAGGINPDNLKEIIDKYKPLLIDVSSGLEESPGKKNQKKIIDFFNILNHNNKINF